MSQYVLDTDVFTLFQHRDPLVRGRVTTALTAGHAVALCIVTVEEQFVGWQKRLNAAKNHAAFAQASSLFARAAQLWGQFPILAETVASRTTFQQFVKLKLNVGKNDLRIASVVLDLGAVLVTRNAVDYRRIPGVKFEDWAAPPPAT